MWNTLFGWSIVLTIIYLGSLGATGRKVDPSVQAARDTRAAAQATIAAQLRDPDSARFTGVTLMKDGSVCGFVNSRNAFGGMTGNNPFVVTPREWSILGREGFPKVWKERCQG